MHPCTPGVNQTVTNVDGSDVAGHQRLPRGDAKRDGAGSLRRSFPDLPLDVPVLWARPTSPRCLVVLNGCDTLDGAEVLLESTAVVVATASSISDLAASVFAAKFYAAIAAAQPVAAAVNQEASPLTWLVSMKAGNSTCWPAQTLTPPSASSSTHPTSTELG